LSITAPQKRIANMQAMLLRIIANPVDSLARSI
jgi:hypothetical protein